jgi:hypothetical protein
VVSALSKQYVFSLLTRMRVTRGFANEIGDFGPDMVFGAQGFEAVPMQGMPMGDMSVYGQQQDNGQMHHQGQGQGPGQGHGGMMSQDGQALW